MLRFYFLILLLPVSRVSNAQSWNWVIHENVKELAVDPAGNVFTCNDSAIKRFDSNGNLQWQRFFCGDLLICDLLADNSGDLYIAAVFDYFSVGSSHFISSGNKDIFLCKIDTSGVILWNKIIGGPGDDNITDMNLSNDQKIVICGNAGKDMNMEGSVFSEKGYFTAEYDPNGSLELFIQHSGAEALEVATDIYGNIYQLGELAENDIVDFGEGVILKGNAISDPFGSHFIAKFNASGNILWAKDLGSNYYQPFKNLAVDNSGDFYLTRWKRYQGFELHKFDKEGDFIWKNNVGGIYGDCLSLCIDNKDSVWLTGYMDDNSKNGQPFIWKFDTSNKLTGVLMATISVTGNNIAFDHNNNIYVSGTFKGSAVFDATKLLASEWNCFLAKMK